MYICTLVVKKNSGCRTLLIPCNMSTIVIKIMTLLAYNLIKYISTEYVRNIIEILACLVILEPGGTFLASSRGWELITSYCVGCWLEVADASLLKISSTGNLVAWLMLRLGEVSYEAEAFVAKSLINFSDDWPAAGKLITVTIAVRYTTVGSDKVGHAAR